MYKVFVNGALTELERITVSAHPFNRVWQGKQRDPSQSEEAYMLRVFGEGELEIGIETDFLISKAVVRPLSKNVPMETAEKSIRFTVGQNGKYAIEINGRKHAIHLLYQKSVAGEELPPPTYRFEDGHHNVGLLRLQSGDSVYISKNAVVHGSLLAVDARDVRIYGDGILCGDWETRTERHGDLGFDNENAFDAAGIHTVGGIRAYRCKNISIRGITVTDTASYGISFFATEGITVDGVNVLGLWKYNCDGIDFFNSANITVKNCFIRSFDDSMCMKGLTAFSYMSTQNAHISNCVFWCDWGKNLDIGLATACPEIKNVVWEDCDIIHNSGICISIANGQWADVHDVTYQNINIEYAGDTERPMIQENDNDVYLPNGKTHVPVLVRISDERRNWQGNIAGEDDRTKIRNICIDRINVISDHAMEELPDVQIRKTTRGSSFENIQIQNVFLDGVPYDNGHRSGNVFENPIYKTGKK